MRSDQVHSMQAAELRIERSSKRIAERYPSIRWPCGRAYGSRAYRGSLRSIDRSLGWDWKSDIQTLKHWLDSSHKSKDWSVLTGASTIHMKSAVTLFSEFQTFWFKHSANILMFVNLFSFLFFNIVHHDNHRRSSSGSLVLCQWASIV